MEIYRAIVSMMSFQLMARVRKSSRRARETGGNFAADNPRNLVNPFS
jgi:hypothetical protein